MFPRVVWQERHRNHHLHRSIEYVHTIGADVIEAGVAEGVEDGVVNHYELDRIPSIDDRKVLILQHGRLTSAIYN